MTWPLLVALTLLALLLLGVAWLWIVGRRPAYYLHRSLGAFEPALRQLAEVMKIGAVYVIEQEGSPHFLQFVRREEGVRFGFPDAPWSRPFFEPVARSLAEAGVPTEVVPTADAVTARFLHADLHGTAAEIGAAAIRVARLAAAAMGLGEEAAYRGHYEGSYDPLAYLAQVEPPYERLAREGPAPVRWFYAWHLRSLRKAAGRPGPGPPAA